MRPMICCWNFFSKNICYKLLFKTFWLQPLSFGIQGPLKVTYLIGLARTVAICLGMSACSCPEAVAMYTHKAKRPLNNCTCMHFITFIIVICHAMGMDCTVYLHLCTTVQLTVLVCIIYSHIKIHVGYSFASHHLLVSSPFPPFLCSNK